MLKVFTLNTELRKHLNRWVPFLEQERPDIICLQETYQDIVDDLAKKLGYAMVFDPRVMITGEAAASGSAILSRFPIVDYRFYPYEQQRDILTRLHGIHESPITSGITIARIDVGGRIVTVGTTHFTWSDGGLVTDEQREVFRRLMTIALLFDDLILCGDFNTPRGSELYDTLATRYKDNVPADVKSTVDPNLHRAKGLELVVDGVFTTPNYEVIGARVHEGLSDHKAVEVTIST